MAKTWKHTLYHDCPLTTARLYNSSSDWIFLSRMDVGVHACMHAVLSLACFLCSDSTVNIQCARMHACMWQGKFHLPGAFASIYGRSVVLKAGTCGHAFHHC